MPIMPLTDEQLELVCKRSEGLCGYNCISCAAFQANLRYNEGYRDDDFEDEEEYEGYD